MLALVFERHPRSRQGERAKMQHIFSRFDAIIVSRAVERACGMLGRSSNYSIGRIRSSIVKFLALGERDFGRLAGIAVKIELWRRRNEECERSLNPYIDQCDIHPKHLH
jgi:hypothetical protein